MSEKSEKKSNPVAGLLGLAIFVVVLVVGFNSCGSHDSASSSPTSTTPSRVLAASSTPAAMPTDADRTYLDAVRAAGASGTDNDLLTDALATCTDFRQDGDSAITISTQLTAAPFNFSQHAADEIVINAVKNICPEFQSKITDPTH